MNLTPLCVFAATASIVLSSAAGAVTTIETIAAGDHTMCQQFLTMVKSARVPQMSDSQLCNFRFARLPRSITKGFTFPHWTQIQVDDPVDMYVHMLDSYVQPGSNFKPPWPAQAKAAVRQAADDQNLVFYTTQVRMGGKGPLITAVQMDIRRECAKLPTYMKYMGVPFVAWFKDAALHHPLPTTGIPYTKELAIREERDLRIPVLLHVEPLWALPIRASLNPAYSNELSLNSLVPAPVKGDGDPDLVYSYGTCQYNLWSKTKITVTVTPSKGL